MGAVQRLATVVIVGLVALATLLVLYLADESNRIDVTAAQQRDDAIERATTLFISNCIICHGPGGQGYLGKDAKDASGKGTSRIGAPLSDINTSLNHTGINDKGTPWPGQVELGVTYPGGFAGRTAWITNRITNGLLTADGKGYVMPPFSESKGGPLNDTQIKELVELIQYGDWNKVYNEAIATFGGYPTPGPAPSTATAPAAGASNAAASTPAAGAAAAGPAYEIDAEDIMFSKTSLTIPANTNVTLKVKNTGATAHTFDIDALKINSGDIAPGTTWETTINAPAGDYHYYCAIPGHEAAGMEGTLTVSASAPVPASASGASASSPAATGTPAASAASPAAASGSAGQTVDLQLEDIHFSKDAITIPANTDVVFNITNTGATTHNFSIDALKINTGDVAAGATVNVTINAPAGIYTYYCDIPGHEAAGMKGTLTVQ